MCLPRLVPSALALLAGLLLSGCPSSVRVESARSATDASAEADAADTQDAIPEPADVPGDLPDGDGRGDVNPEVMPPCRTDADCTDLADPDACRVGRCVDGGCVARPVPGCCRSDADCQPPVDKPCLAGICLDHACAWKPVPGCCATDAACDDGDPCTRDVCDGRNGTCAHVPDPACGGCTSDAQCADDDPCTKDRCQNGACAHVPDPACGGCTSDAQCKDGDACTVDACVGNTCLHEALPDCACHVDADCQDQNPCTVDRCKEGQCGHAQVPDCCLSPLDCSDGNACTWDLCTDNTCYSYAATEQPGCCAVDGDCPPVADPCQVAVCRADFHCAIEVAPGCCTEQVVLGATFDADAPGWALLPANKPVRWTVDPHRYASAPAALYFGNPNTLTYAIPGQPSAGTATTALVEFPANVAVRLRFALWLDVEAQPNVDRLAVRVLEAGSGTPVWTKAELAPALYRTWTDVEVDLSAWAGHAVRLQFAFDSVDALDNASEGVVIDDVDVRAPCGP